MSSFSKKEINKIFRQNSSRLRTEWFDIIVSPRTTDIARILVIISRKIGNAPARNKLRRRLKSIFYEEKIFNLPNDYIFIAKPGSAQLTFDQLKDIMNAINIKTSLIDKNTTTSSGRADEQK